MRLALALALLPSWASAGCLTDDYARDALRWNGFALSAWQVVPSGAMEELWLAEDGRWTLLLIRPDHCTTIISRPHDFGGRLSTPSNDADPGGFGPMTRGERG